MQRVTSILPSWNQTKTGSKKGFDKVWAWSDKLGAPVNRLTNKIGSEAFWPMTLEKESDKAARILRSFCKDGFYAEDDYPSQDGPKSKQKVLKKIPQIVIQNAVGLAIFTTMRSGLWISGAGGSGILVARLEDGSWSPPSGILLHTAGIGFLAGVDIYDCVLVINTRTALESFTRVRATLGGEISAVAGPVGIGGVLENDGKWKQLNKPVFTYLKSRGFYAGVQVDGTIIIERNDENERFYGEAIKAQDILAGKARHPPYEIKMLMETIKAAEGRDDVDKIMMEELEDQPAPGDVELDAPISIAPVFGVPEPDDPDPFGVLALEREGMEIREAGTKSRPDSGQFSYNPSPTSPVYSTYYRRSMIDFRTNRTSLMSMMTSGTGRTSRTSIDRSMLVSAGTQTDDDLPSPSWLKDNWCSSRSTTSRSTRKSISPERIIEEQHEPVTSPSEMESPSFSKITRGPYHSGNNSFSGSTVTVASSVEKEPEKHESLVHGSTEDGSEDEGDGDYEEPVIYEAAKAHTANAPTLMSVNVVSIAKRIPPALPPRSSRRVDRNSARSSTGSLAKTARSISSSSENLRSSSPPDVFDEVDLNAENETKVKAVTMNDIEEEEKQNTRRESASAPAGAAKGNENFMPGGW